nr:unnamed protein product [Callosobruchus chinensis]
MDAFTLNWGNLFFYTFPAFSLLPRVLKKIKAEKAKGIVVYPLWKTQPWFPVLESLQIADPIFFSSDKTLLLSPYRKPQPSVEEPYAGCVRTLWLAYKSRGVAETAINILISSRAENTIKQYNTTYKKWQRPNICVASTLKYYIDFTKTLRKNNDQLLITTKKPHHPATPQTVSKWFKKGLTLGSVDTSVFKAHSTRHASTSAVFRGGLNIETIRRTAGWSDRSNVFLTFYNRPISDDSDFEKPLINKN